MNSIKFIYTRT